MTKFIKKSFVMFIGLSMFLNIARAQQTPDQALEACMNKTMAQSAAVGALVGGLFGAMIANKGDKNKGAALGAGLGAAAGGAIGWQNSWKSCTESVNVVTINNLQTEDYKKTAERLGYAGQGVLLKVEGLGVSQQVIAGNKLNASLKFVLLKPEPAETSEVQITRSWVCGSSEISIKPEIFTVAQGTIIQDGKVQIPSVKPDVGAQQCEMTMKIEAEGQSYQVKRPFTIQPG
jgi:Glycine zipper 2TM domain